MIDSARSLEAVRLRKSYGSRLALDDVSLGVNAGEIVGLLGPNGAGKTTTLSILATLMRPDSGDVRICGFGSDSSPAEIRRSLGFVPQSIALYPSLSGLQNLEFFARVHGLARAEAREAALTALGQMGLADRADEPVSVLSGGMKRRVNLACGMVHGPQVLLLDEPTVGVDPQSREQILAIVQKCAASGVAVIYSTHYMEEVERICGRALLIDNGRLVASGTIPELIALAGRQHRMTLTCQGSLPPNWCDGIDGVDQIAPQDQYGRLALRLSNPGQAAEVTERARAAGCRVLEFSVHSPNLSDAFMSLTGHTLREPEQDLL